MELKRVAFADFETEAIEGRPRYPPKPVGLAIMAPGHKPFYHAWGHPTYNNSSMADAKHHYQSLVREGYVFCWHHAGFDLDVMETHVGVPWPTEHHDTLILAFLDDPRSSTFSLKPLAEKLLGEAPTERDELRDWIVKNVPEARQAKTRWGAYIARAPGDLVGRYAKGDITRTAGLFRRYVKTVLGEPRLVGAYDRERNLTRVMIRMERRGVPVATRRLEKDIPVYEKTLNKMEAALKKRLKVPKSQWDDFTWSGDSLADALERVGAVKEWIMTDPSQAHPTGQRSTSIDSLREVEADPVLIGLLERRSQLQTFLSTFMRPWLIQGRENGGRFYARYNQVRQDYHGSSKKQVGTETGRLSMTPNLQNVPRKVDDPNMPVVRDYIVPGVELNGVRFKAGRLCIIKRDYSQQELRILADRENGPFLAKYLDNPKIDAHVAVKELIEELVHIIVERRQTKDINFGVIYGMGITKLALKLGLPLKQARILLRAHAAALPGLKTLKEELDALAKSGEPLFTWGGRRYYCEPPKFVKKFNRVMDFGYKMLNTYVQGSAADCTKKAMLNYYEAGYDDEFPLILQVHDELLTLAQFVNHMTAHECLNECMADVKFKVPMLSDGSTGRSWAKTVKVNV